MRSVVSDLAAILVISITARFVISVEDEVDQEEKR